MRSMERLRATASAIVLGAAAAGCTAGGAGISPPRSAASYGSSGAPLASGASAQLANRTSLSAQFATATGQATPVAGIGSSTVTANVGINVEGVSDYSIAQQFVDAVRQSRPWGNPNSPYDQAVSQSGEVDANGWPTVDAGLLVLCCVASDNSTADPGTASELDGTYALSFTGKATVRIPIGYGTVANYAYDAATNTSTASVTFVDTSRSPLYLSFTSSQRTATSPVGSGVTGVHLIRPQTAPNGMRWWDASTQTFTDPFLATLKPYTTLRFMDWTATNNSPVVHWSDRTQGTYATNQRQVAHNGGFAPTGASWEDAIALANATHEDMWINVPAMATDYYVSRLAMLLKSSLDPSRHVYVEYSNEVWNGQFTQFAYNLNLASSEAGTDTSYKANCDATDQYRWGQCRVARRLQKISSTFSTVFGQSAIGTTIRPVFATQLDQSYFLSGALNFIAKTYGQPSRFFYGIAQAPYWEGDQSANGESETQELESAETSLKATVPSSTADFTAYAVYYGLHNFTYEGGPGMSGTPSLAAKIAANSDPQIGSQVSEALGDFYTHGGDMFVYYNDTSAYSQYGMWGTTPDVFDRSTPKIQALTALAGTSQMRSVGATLPGTFAGNASAFTITSGGFATASYLYYKAPAARAYLIDAPSGGTYSLSLKVGSYATTPGQATISVGAARMGTITTPTTGGNPSNETTSPSLTITVPQGLSILEVAATAGEFGLYSIDVAQSSATAQLRARLR